MRLPTAQRAIVESKVRDYLLSFEHSRGGTKARLFKALGYSRDRWHELGEALKEHAEKYEATVVGESEYGVKYEVTGELAGPSGRNARIKVVWIVLRGEDVPRLVTAFRQRGSK